MKNFFFSLRNKFRLLKSDLPLLLLVSRDSRTPVSTKLIMGLTIVYLFSPIDLIPDFIPFLGLADDLLMVPFLISVAVKTVPDVILNDARLRLKSVKSKARNWMLIFLIVTVCAILAYYGYQYYDKDFTWN